MNRDDFIHALADKNGYTLKDNEMLLETFVAVLSECIQKHVEVDVRGFFHLSFKTVKGGYHRFKKSDVAKLYPSGTRVLFSLGRNLKDLIKEQM